MATILKSNSASNKYLISGLKLSLPTDYRVAMDFNNEEYSFDGVTKSLTDLITVNRNSGAGYINAQGQYEVAGVNTARIHHDPSAGKGLLVEPAFTNLLANPSTPVTQTITATLSQNNWFIVQVWGSGSATIEIKNASDVVQVTGVATESQPFLWLIPLTLSGAKITVTPSNLTQMQAHQTGLPRKLQSKALSIGSIYADDVLFNKSVLSSILSKKNEFTIVLKRSEIPDSVVNTSPTLRYVNILQVGEESTTKGVFVAAKKGASKKGTLRVMQTTETLTENIDSVSNEVYALTFNGTEAKMYQNGSIVTLPITEALALTRMYIASGTIWPGSNVGNAGQVIKELYLYDRAFDNSELLGIAY